MPTASTRGDKTAKRWVQISASYSSVQSPGFVIEVFGLFSTIMEHHLLWRRSFPVSVPVPVPDFREFQLPCSSNSLCVKVTWSTWKKRWSDWAGNSWLGVGCQILSPLPFGPSYSCLYRPLSLASHTVHPLEGVACETADHSACISFLNHPRPSGKLARWAMTMDLVIKHRSGKSNTNADALSRNPVS